MRIVGPKRTGNHGSFGVAEADRGARVIARRIGVKTKKPLILTCGAVLALLFVGVVLSQLLTHSRVFGQSRSEPIKVVRAERVELVDATGRIRAALTEVGEDAGLVFFDSQGRAAVLLTAKDDGLTLRFLEGHSVGKIQNAIDRAKSLSEFWHFSYGADARHVD